ncbi:MAG TPA: type I phosphomannose isomerase catalytic subunit [Terriglobales bacterium]|nr:type I phosphomannose isomerase catalytic subunit [Terriglobales bacterium]
MDLYPLLLLPEFSPRPWGATDLSPIYAGRKFAEKIGEAWLTGDECKVANGPLAGQRLADLAERFGRDLVGDSAREPKRFPLLLKFLFPHDKLSVQVHPDDACAQRVGQPWGKTECWYVLHAEKGAQVALGLKSGTTREQLRQAIQETRAEELLNWIDIHAGEMIYVAGGTVHAIAAGSILVETQQSSDTTYRLYDYGRPRPLHLEQGLQAVKERTGSGKVRHAAGNGHGGQDSQELIAAPFFVVEKLALREPREFTTREEGQRRVEILVAVNGCGVLEGTGAPEVTFAPGEAVVVPACLGDFRVRPQWSVEFLRARVPAHARPEPAVV